MKILKYIIAILIIASVSFFFFFEKEIASLDRPIPANLSENLREDHRKLPFSGAHNFRDLGGYKTQDGRTVKWGKVYRSDNLHSLTDEDVNYMERLNIKSVVDFRSDEEREDEPDRLTPNMTQILLPILFRPKEIDDGTTKDLVKDLTFGNLDATNLLYDFNIAIVKQFTEEYKTFFRHIVDNNAEPLVLHCTAGKDRAGFASAMVLSLLGVPREKVIDGIQNAKTIVKIAVVFKPLSTKES